MLPRWADALLMVEHGDVAVAIMPWRDETALAASPLDDMKEGPSSWGPVESGTSMIWGPL